MKIYKRTLKQEHFGALMLFMLMMLFSMAFFTYCVKTGFDGVFEYEYLSPGWIASSIALILSYFILKASLAGLVINLINFMVGHRERNIIDLISGKLTKANWA